MPVILAINPGKRTRPKKKPSKKNPTKKRPAKKAGRKTTKKGSPVMAKRRKRRAPAKTKTIIRYRTKKNPTRKKRAVRAVGRSIGGINIGAAAKGTLPMLIGALAAKFSAKKFADGGGEGENWTWKNYGLGLLGGFLAAFGTSAIFGGKKVTAQEVMKGAFLLTAYKVFTNEIAPQNSTLEAWFSGDEDAALPEWYGQPEEAGGNVLYQPDGAAYIQGADGNYHPANDSHRTPQFADGVVPVDPAMGFGDGVVPVDPSMGQADHVRPKTWAEAHGR